MHPSSALTRTTLGLALAVLAAGGAAAQGVVNARVLSSTPVWEPVPVSDCAPGSYGGRTSGGGAGVGAVMGGLIGSQMGKGSGHIAGAILGALGGAMLGNAAEASQGGYYGGYPGQCGTRYENRVTGYDVTYEMGGRQYQTRTAQAPGAWIQVPGDPYYGQGGYGGAQTYPVNPPPMAGYPLPAYPAAGEGSGVVTAPPVYGGYPGQYPNAYPGYPAPGYAQTYPAPVYAQPVYPQPVYQAAPVYVRPAPVYAAPVGVNLSIGGVIGGGHRHHRGGWGVGIGTGF